MFRNFILVTILLCAAFITVSAKDNHTGNVGIGTPNPTSKLDVNGSIGLKYRTINNSCGLGVDDFAVTYTGDSSITLTLPDATNCNGRIYTVINASTAMPAPKITVVAIAGQKINGKPNWIFDVTNESAMLLSTGNGWSVHAQSVASYKTDSTGGAWKEGGNMTPSTATRKFGTLTNNDLPFISNNKERMRITKGGNIGIGTTTPDTSAILDLNSTTKGLLIPRMTSAERSAIATPQNGLMVYDTDSSCIYFFNARKSVWTNTCRQASCVTGVTGATGPQGPAGANGATGAQGPAGINGTNGINGVTGPQGAAGAVGATGAQGPAGTNGTNGIAGATGAKGTTGATGAQGVAGTNGTNGINGATGAQGPAGANGTNGINGATGATGPQGQAGTNGATGAQGPAGANGTNGINGVTGATGAQGPAGIAGIAGTNGANGVTGAQGPAGTNGTNGAVGATGAKGATGATGLTGATGAQGPAGSNGTNGVNGATGAQGPAGTNGTNGINGATGAQGVAGTNGSNGTIGATGATGPIGPTGASAVATAFTGATASTAGTMGAVPAPAAGNQNKFLTGGGGWVTGFPLITASGTATTTTELRDYNAWVTRGTGFYLTDVGGAISNGIPNEGAWFTFSQVATGGSYFGQTSLNDHDFYFRGGTVAGMTSTVWQKMLSVPASSKVVMSVDAFSNASLTNGDNGYMSFGTNNTERLRIDANGNTGIGTTNPGNKLEVNSGTGGVSGLRLKQLTSGGVLFVNSTADVAQNTSNFYFDATNYRLGITAGTSPNSTLQVGGSVSFGITTKTANYTASVSDHTILCNNSSNITISLPAASGCTGRIYIIKKISSGSTSVTIDPSGSENIDGSNTKVISTQYTDIIVQSDGANWFIIN